MFSDYFDVLISKITLKKNIYFNIFLNKKYFKKQLQLHNGRTKYSRFGFSHETKAHKRGVECEIHHCLVF
jgi:hypothetical protein